jgi:hypothetical protein
VSLLDLCPSFLLVAMIAVAGDVPVTPMLLNRFAYLPGEDSPTFDSLKVLYVPGVPNTSGDESAAL